MLIKVYQVIRESAVYQIIKEKFGIGSNSYKISYITLHCNDTKNTGEWIIQENIYRNERGMGENIYFYL